MKSILKILLTAFVVVILAKIIPGVTVASYMYAIFVAIILSLLKFIVRPILIILTLPVTIVTFGLFLFIINALLIMLTDFFISGFEVSSIWTALLFSILLSIFQSVLFTLVPDSKKD
ncbi:phage holin family protein [Dokdonia sp. Hel_I_53]|uniref:phage holin family protein n=1 Tax=Dokdonia sp. Hel_I_53 TaxID=1566287 RepID=UPI00119C5C75|nr:phage holin family protein [Dokdonia sp. Hel_I_53]TVZ52348.1 putative membrane protein [Dokdonia sp. Hel_I_53]